MTDKQVRMAYAVLGAFTVAWAAALVALVRTLANMTWGAP